MEHYSIISIKSERCRRQTGWPGASF